MSLRAARAALVADAERGRHDRAAAMRRADAIAVVELDAVRRRAAEERGVEQVVALRAARHRDFAAAGAHAREHFLGIGRDIARRARDHHADGVEQMPPRVVAHFVGEVGVAQAARELDDGARSRQRRDAACTGSAAWDIAALRSSFPSPACGSRGGAPRSYPFSISFTIAG